MLRTSFVCGLLLTIFLGTLCTSALAEDQDRPLKKGILLVAFGTTVPEARVALDNFETRAKERFPEMDIRWAYSSSIVRKILADDGLAMDSPVTALAKMMDDGFTHVAVQSLHTIPGQEFHDLQKTVQAFSGLPKGMEQVTLGQPLLDTPEDLGRCVQAMLSVLPQERKKDEAVVWMGHGTHHAANIYYPGLQAYLHQADPLILVGTVEGDPSLEDVLALLKNRKVSKAYLQPFMAVAGDHAQNDMAGDDEDSWKSMLEAQKITCVPILRGTAEFPAFVDLWMNHLQAAVDLLP
ncbi:MAG: sirohydrochlorin cobaltochelatase [Desulfomicrobium sp.]|nr:sirohydrochlorin cobaltochelatase [Desulfomicrobium sp.]NLV96984.1 sirohydrochlorin cobaltochelatase [Desulfovibrionales bacterium]